MKLIDKLAEARAHEYSDIYPPVILLDIRDGYKAGFKQAIDALKTCLVKLWSDDKITPKEYSMIRYSLVTDMMERLFVMEAKDGTNGPDKTSSSGE